MTLPMPPLDGLGLLFIATALVFAAACLVALWAILRRGGSPAGREADHAAAEEREWWSSDAGRPARPGVRAVLEELVWLAVPVLLLLWLWRSI